MSTCRTFGYLLHRLDEAKYHKGVNWADKKHLCTLKGQVRREQTFENEAEVESYQRLIREYGAEMKRRSAPRMSVE